MARADEVIEGKLAKSPLDVGVGVRPGLAGEVAVDRAQPDRGTFGDLDLLATVQALRGFQHEATVRTFGRLIE